MEQAKWTAAVAFAFAIGSVGLSILAAVFVVSETGLPASSISTDVFMYLAYWPSMIVGFMGDVHIATLRQLLANSTGWAIVGAVLSILDFRKVRDSSG